MITPELLHYGAAVTTIIISTHGAGIALGIASSGAQDAFNRQPTGHNHEFRAMIIGLALIESGAIIALVTTLLILLRGVQSITMESAIVEMSIGLMVGITAAAASIASSFAVRSATQAIARQPLFASKIITFMLLSQTIIEAPVIFAFIVGIIIKSQLPHITLLSQALHLCAASTVMAVGCIGPSIGQGIFSYAAGKAIGINKNAYNRLFPFSLINQAFVETPMIFCVFLAMLMLYTPLPTTTSLNDPIRLMTAGLTLAVGSFGSAIGIGYVGAHSCKQIALEPHLYGTLIRATLLVIAFIESVGIYALIIAMFLITKVQ